jgi:HPt (histidine-containing phosphotransfer) domain-containing protein
MADPAPSLWPSDFGSPALDPDTLDRLDELSPGGNFVTGLAGWFLADAEVQLRSLRQALDRGDIALLTFTAHTLTGSSAIVGASELAPRSALVSAPEAPTDWLRVARVLAAMDRELERARTAFDAWATTV